MFNKDDYADAQDFENRSTRSGDDHAAIFYANVILLIQPTDIEDLETRSQIQHAINFLENWLKKQKNRILPRRDDLVKRIVGALADWYQYTYRPGEARHIDGEQNYAPTTFDETANFESLLHQIWRQEKNLTRDSDKTILERIHAMKPTQAIAQVITETPAPPVMANVLQISAATFQPSERNSSTNASSPGKKV